MHADQSCGLEDMHGWITCEVHEAPHLYALTCTIEQTVYQRCSYAVHSNSVCNASCAHRWKLVHLEGSRGCEALNLLAPLQDSYQGANYKGSPPVAARCPLIICCLGSDCAGRPSLCMPYPQTENCALALTAATCMQATEGQITRVARPWPPDA